MRTIVVGSSAALLGLVVSTTSVRADDMPTRKAGLWEVTMHMSVANMPPQVMKFCTDAATDAALFKLGMNAAQGMCSHQDMHRSGSVVTVDTECKLGETDMTSHSVMTFTGDTAYQTESKSHFNPPMMGRSDSTTTQEAKWTGPCPADMQAGDLIGPNGMKMNMKSLGQ